MKKNKLYDTQRNKYSIRKFTVGTASILVGALVFLGTSDAEAAQDEKATPNSVQDKAVDSSEQQPEVSQSEEPNVDESKPQGDVAQPETGEEVKAPETPDADAQPQDTQEQPQKDPHTEPAQEEPQNKDDAQDDVKSDEQNKQVEENKKDSEVQDKKTESSVKEQAEAPKEEVKPVEQSTPENVVAPRDVAQPTPVAVQPTEVENADVVAKNEADAAAQKVSKDTVSEGVSSEDLRNVADPKDTPLAVVNEKNVTKKASAADDGPQGSNVNDKVTFKDLKYSTKEFDGNQSGGTDFDAKFDVANGVNPNDYFTIKLPEYLNLYGNRPADNVGIPDLINIDGDTLATGTYDVDKNTVTYKFTDGIQGKDKVRGKVHFSLWPDREKAPQEDTYNMRVDAAGETLEEPIKINYTSVRNLETPKANIESFITETSDNTYTQFVYVNPKGEKHNYGTVDIFDFNPDKGVDASSGVINNLSKVKIYKVPADQHLKQSFHVDEDRLEDVTSEFLNSNTVQLVNKENGGHSVFIDFADKMADGSRYVVRVDGEVTDPEKPVQTRVLMNSYDENKEQNGPFYFWDNENIIKENSGDIDGEEKRVNLGDFVWFDENKDGVQNKDEQGLAGVKVTLKNENGEVVQTVETNEKGNYQFKDLVPGKYQVVFDAPAGYLPTEKYSGYDYERDSNGQVVNVNLTDDDYSIDSGFYKEDEPKVKLGDYVWEDTDKDGVQGADEKGIANVKVTLKDADGNVVKETVTDDQGKYLFEELDKGKYTVDFETPAGYTATTVKSGQDGATDSDGTSVEVDLTEDNLTIDSGFYKEDEPKVKLGDFVWEDTNKNGVQDSEEDGIAGVKVVLRDAAGNVVKETVTDTTGQYLFEELDKGKYTVEFETPAGYTATSVKSGQDRAADSDGTAVEVDLTEDNLTIDSGFYKEEPKLKLGDFVWEDTNKNGVQDSEEDGIAGVKVVLKDASGKVVGETVTDVTGQYLFEGLAKGKYTVEFEAPAGYTATLVRAGGDSVADSDGQVVEVDLTEDNLTIDSGFYKDTPVDPDEPDKPNKPQPDEPQKPQDPEKPSEPTPDQPNDPNKPQPQTYKPGEPTQPQHVGTAKKQTPQKALPDTGETPTSNPTWFGTLFAALGAALLFRRKKSNDNK